MGTPGSPKRTWAENDMFRLLFPSPALDLLVDRVKTVVGFPGFPVEFGGVVEPHEAFLTESLTREPVWCRVQEIRVARLLRPTYALANVGHPSSFYWALL
jgi:hypothetical protein